MQNIDSKNYPNFAKTDLEESHFRRDIINSGLGSGGRCMSRSFGSSCSGSQIVDAGGEDMQWRCWRLQRRHFRCQVVETRVDRGVCERGLHGCEGLGLEWVILRDVDRVVLLLRKLLGLCSLHLGLEAWSGVVEGKRRDGWLVWELRFTAVSRVLGGG